MDIEASGPYGQAWDAYRRAGWSGVLPLPPGHKGPPPAGFTGWAGIDPSRADIQAWLDDPRLGGAANIGLHLPSGVYGLDVDNYDGKTGGAALAQLVEQLGPPPSTWVVSSRDDGVSGIRLYRVTLPPGRVWIDEPGGHGVGIEAIHKGHRYAVAWPSIHPETGRVYTWRHDRPDYPIGEGSVPTLAELPELPAVWVEALSRTGEVRQGTQAGHDETVATVTGWRDGEPCERVARAAERAMGGLAAAAAGAALHPASEAGTWELACLGHEGHAGVRRALAEHYAGHLDARVARDGEASRREADGEWWRLVRGAIGKLVGPPVGQCDCDLWSGIGVTFTPEDLGVPNSRIADQTDGEFSSFDGEPAATGLDGPRDLTGWTLSPAELMARPRPEPIVSGLLYRDTLAWLIGKSGSFKSFVALDLAAAVADENGRKWLGRAVYGGPVLYVVAEGAGGMGLRIQAWTERNGPMSDRLRLLPRAVQAKGEHWSTLVELARQLGPALIVIDTQARVSVGVNENSNTEIGELIARLDELRRATRACVLVVHHIGRTGEDARGASALDGAQDTELKVERVGGPKALRVKLTVDKQKDAPDTDAMTLDLETVDLGRDELTGEALSSLIVLPDLVLDPFPVESWRLVKNENQGLILSILREQFSEHGGTRAEVAAVLREQGQRGEAKYSKTTFYDAWNAILQKDLIERIQGTQRFILTDAALSNTLTCVGPETRN